MLTTRSSSLDSIIRPRCGQVVRREDRAAWGGSHKDLGADRGERAARMAQWMSHQRRCLGFGRSASHPRRSGRTVASWRVDRCLDHGVDLVSEVVG
jgi:hypothetical protein